MNKLTQRLTILTAAIIWGTNSASGSSLRTMPCPELLAREQTYLFDSLFNPVFQRKARKCRQEAKLIQARIDLDDTYNQLFIPDLTFREYRNELFIDAISKLFTGELENPVLQIKHQSQNPSEAKKTGSIPGYTTIGQ